MQKAEISDLPEGFLLQFRRGIPVLVATKEPHRKVLTIEPVSPLLKVIHPEIFPGVSPFPRNPQLQEYPMQQPQQAQNPPSSVPAMVLKGVVSIAIVLVVSLGLSAISVWQKGRVAEIEKTEAVNAGANAQADLIKSQAELNRAQAQVMVQAQAPTGGRTLRPSEVPQHLRAESFPTVSSAVPCTAGGQGLEIEGLNRPVALSSGFELEPGKCFFARPVGKARQIEGNNAFMELYDTAGTLKDRCEFTQASIATCSKLHDQALAGHGVLRIGTRYGGYAKYSV